MINEPLTDAELTEWREHGFTADQAAAWFQGMHEQYGPPSERWGLIRGETPSECALSFAIYWRDMLPAPEYDDAALWIAEFPGPGLGAELACPYRDAGWGAPGGDRRTIAEAANFAYLKLEPKTAAQWVLAGFNSEAAAPYVRAGLDPLRARSRAWTDTELAELACTREASGS